MAVSLSGEGQALSPSPPMRILLLGKSGSGEECIGKQHSGKEAVPDSQTRRETGDEGM
uniref:AIG1-type G domain-containing protein n=1 Tax=Anguilla anguilla TaxID=7936 RepID=A0A0E9RGW7_ANGAN